MKKLNIQKIMSKKILAMVMAIMCIIGSMSIAAYAEDISVEPIENKSVQLIEVDDKGMLTDTDAYSSVFYYDISVGKFFYQEEGKNPGEWLYYGNPYTGDKGTIVDGFPVYPTAISGTRFYSLVCPVCNYRMARGQLLQIEERYNDRDANMWVKQDWTYHYGHCRMCDTEITLNDIFVEYGIYKYKLINSEFKFTLPRSENTLENFQKELAKHQTEVDSIIAENKQRM